MLFGVLLTIQIILCVAMVGIILVQRSEGGALGMGGGPSGFMSARGAGNLLTRVTSVLAFLFFVNCIALTIAGNMKTAGTSVVDRVGVDAIDPSKLAQPQPGQALPAQPQTAPAPAQNSLSNLPLPTQQLPQALPQPVPQAAQPATQPVPQAAKPVAPVVAKPAPKPAAEPSPKPEAAKPAEEPAPAPAPAQ